ncbi:hypothetical protein [Roseococcus sp. YIM B11640]|uniref:hypothetical protein n=1 Tax=Roseococcus sp. YIM B11640 TaxID=3133973 RepID=UPI003C7AB757
MARQDVGHGLVDRRGLESRMEPPGEVPEGRSWITAALADRFSGSAHDIKRDRRNSQPQGRARVMLPIRHRSKCPSSRSE